MKPVIDNSHLKTAVNAAIEAKETALEMRAKLTVQSKQDGTTVTNADKRVEEVVREILTSQSNFPVWGEERDKEPDTLSYWVVDPIDGTRNYANGIPIYSVSIALVLNGKLEVCAIANPEFNEILYAVRGSGAYCNDSKITVKQSASPEGYTSCASGYGAVAAHRLCCEVNEYVQRFTASVYSMVTVATGSNDFCIMSGVYPWDVAAGALLVQEAGGDIESFTRGAKSWDSIKNGGFIAWNGQSVIREDIYRNMSEEMRNKLTRHPKEFDLK